MNSTMKPSLFNNNTKSNSPQKSTSQRQRKNLELKDVERLLNLRLELLCRVESLPHISIAKIPYITAVGDMISLPGPWSIEVSSVASSAVASITTSPTNIHDHADDLDGDNADDLESVSDYGELQAGMSRSPMHQVARGLRSVSNATTASAMSSFDPATLTPSTPVNEAANTAGGAAVPRFVVRNEFGHVRVQPLIELLEAMQERSRTNAANNQGPSPQMDILRIGGHIVLPMADFEMCIESGLGEQHPFAGRHHPIAGNTIPETTLLFYGPRTEEELEVVWSLVRKSYEWVFSSCR